MRSSTITRVSAQLGWIAPCVLLAICTGVLGACCSQDQAKAGNETAEVQPIVADGQASPDQTPPEYEAQVNAYFTRLNAESKRQNGGTGAE